MEHHLDASFDQATDPADMTGEEQLAISWKHQIEFEYGITDHWDFGIYQYFRQNAFSSVGTDQNEPRAPTVSGA